MPFTAGQKLRASQLNTPWVSTLSNDTYNHPVTNTVWAAAPGMGPFTTLVVPSGSSLEIEFDAPLIDIPSATGLQVRIVAAGANRKGAYWSNSGSASFAVPGLIRARYTGTGVTVSYQIEVQKVGPGTPSIQSIGLGPVQIWHRIV